MAQLDFAAAFGNKIAKNQVTKDERPKAQFWLNIGYTVVVQQDGEQHEKFVSLPTGIPLDSMELLKTNSQNEMWAAFQAARNNLHEQIMELAKSLKPGEEKILGIDSGNGLAIQLRRVNEEQAAVKPENNAFVTKLKFA